MFYVYTVICKDPNCIYVGYTKDHHRRRREHFYGKTSEFISRHGGAVTMSIISKHKSCEDAKQAEYGYCKKLLSEGFNAAGPIIERERKLTADE